MCRIYKSNDITDPRDDNGHDKMDSKCDLAAQAFLSKHVTFVAVEFQFLPINQSITQKYVSDASR